MYQMEQFSALIREVFTEGALLIPGNTLEKDLKKEILEDFMMSVMITGLQICLVE